MNNKKLANSDLLYITKLISEHKYLSSLEINELSIKFKMCRSVLIRELLKNKIPFRGRSIYSTLESIGVSHNKNSGPVLMEKLNNLQSWQIEMLSGSKLKVKYNCQECSNQSESRLSHMINRKFFTMQPICAKCILKKVTNTPEWRQTNSEAQIIAQNKIEQIEKNRNAQIKRLKSIEARKKHSDGSKKVWQREEHREKMSNIALKKWDDPVYAQKVIMNSKTNFKNGKYKEIYYHSGYELAFLLKFEESFDLKDISRANFYISYKDKNNKIKHYYPDFLINNNVLVEVKGYGPWVDLENLKLKNNAAKNWCKKNNIKFRLVEKEDLEQYYIKKAKKIHNEIKEQKNNSI